MHSSGEGPQRTEQGEDERCGAGWGRWKTAGTLTTAILQNIKSNWRELNETELLVMRSTGI